MIRHRSTFALMAAAALLGAGAMARTAEAGNLGLPDHVNALIFNNMTASGGDTEGGLYVGNDANITSYSVGLKLPNSHGAKDHFVVGHNMNTGSWQVYGGNAVYGNSVTTPPTTTNGTTRKESGVFDFATAQTELTAASAHWASLAANGSAVYQWSTYTLTGTDSQLNIFEVNPTDWANASHHVIIAPAGSTVLINIAGETAGMKNGMELQGGVDVTHVLFNFHEALTLTIESMGVLGSVVAPTASLTLKGGHIDGLTVVYDATTMWGGEFHWYGGFQGDLPSPPDDSQVVVGVPTPSGATVGFFSGLTAMAMHWRGRRRASGVEAAEA